MHASHKQSVSGDSAVAIRTLDELVQAAICASVCECWSHLAPWMMLWSLGRAKQNPWSHLAPWMMFWSLGLTGNAQHG